ncbi:hypothetical protein LMG27198_13560 [Methylocystis echinoides]|uniref:Uncharacterized protein n=1 Tax=Methylocystis echinoides TaxID=29468 RepID=A0A9W6LRJ9_9HYPH|nr:hypothetical protein LMG27198_13560 [Methylocystis echinoides]
MILTRPRPKLESITSNEEMAGWRREVNASPQETFVVSSEGRPQRPRRGQDPVQLGGKLRGQMKGDDH